MDTNSKSDRPWVDRTVRPDRLTETSIVTGAEEHLHVLPSFIAGNARLVAVDADGFRTHVVLSPAEVSVLTTALWAALRPQPPTGEYPANVVGIDAAARARRNIEDAEHP